MSGRQSLVARGSERFVARRRVRRRRALIGGGIFGVVLLSVVLYELNQPFLRISNVQVFGGDVSLQPLVTDSLQGKYLGIIPRDSIIFYPASEIRNRILSADTNVAAVALFRNGLTGLSVRVDSRTPVARWCGIKLSKTVELATSSIQGESLEDCYVFDASGFIYARESTSLEPINKFKLYSPLKSGTEPLNATVKNYEKLPATFDFARELSVLGANVETINIVGDEVSNTLVSGTRVSYVLGEEQSAFTALNSARDSFNLKDGSIDYIDLRFGGKVYVKRK